MDYPTIPDTACWTPLALEAPLLRVDTTMPDRLPEIVAWVRGR